MGDIKLKSHLNQSYSVLTPGNKLWTQAGDYTDLGLIITSNATLEQMLNHLRKKADHLGFNLVEKSSGNLVSEERYIAPSPRLGIGAASAKHLGRLLGSLL